MYLHICKENQYSTKLSISPWLQSPFFTRLKPWQKRKRPILKIRKKKRQSIKVVSYHGPYKTSTIFFPTEIFKSKVFKSNVLGDGRPLLGIDWYINIAVWSQHNLFAQVTKKGGESEISRFWKIQEIKENSENQNIKRTSTWLNIWTSWAENKNFGTNLMGYEAKQIDEKNNNNNKQIIAWFVCDIWHKYHSLYFKIVPNFTRLTAREIMKHHSWYFVRYH